MSNNGENISGAYGGKKKKISDHSKNRKKYGDRKESANKVSKEARKEHRSQQRKRTDIMIGPGSGGHLPKRSKEERKSDKAAWKNARAAKKAFKKDPSPDNRAALKTAKRRKAAVKQKSAERAYKKFM